jgi:hypothetical protein
MLFEALLQDQSVMGGRSVELTQLPASGVLFIGLSVCVKTSSRGSKYRRIADLSAQNHNFAVIVVPRSLCDDTRVQGHSINRNEELIAYDKYGSSVAGRNRG